MTLNAAVHSADILPEFWTDKPGKDAGSRFLPLNFGVDLVGKDDVRVTGPERKGEWTASTSVYELRVSLPGGFCASSTPFVASRLTLVLLPRPSSSRRMPELTIDTWCPSSRVRDLPPLPSLALLVREILT
jgi:hypothetical protein